MPTTRGTSLDLADPNLEHVCAAWPPLDAERGLDARPVADMLYHVRTLLVAAPYVKRWLLAAVTAGPS